MVHFHRRMNRVDAQLSELVQAIDAVQHETVSLRKQLDSVGLIEIKHNRAFYLVAEPGHSNYGDELIAREWVRYLALRQPDVPAYIDCARPGPAAAILRGEHPRLSVVDTLACLTRENEFAGGDVRNQHTRDIARFVVQALHDEGKAARYASGIELLRSAVRSVHVLGGGYLNSMWRVNLARLSVAAWARGRGVPAVATGIGLMPLQEPDDSFVREAAASFLSFSVRDAESYRAVMDSRSPQQVGDRIQEMARTQISLAPDDCFVNALDRCYAPPEGLPDTMVCVQSDFVDDAAALHRHVIATLNSWEVGRGAMVGVVECNPYVDYPIVESLKAAGYRVAFFPLASLLREGFPARAGQRWLTTRYHPHLLAAAQGCTGSFITVGERYYAIKHRAVLRMGSHWTNSVIGTTGVLPGSGFEDSGVLQEYSRQIRKAADVIYHE